jgi:polyferredoxin
MCVTTCPTGIDIREGLQLECVGCAQCIDACDAVMAKLKRPLGLIRYSSQAAIEGQKRHLIRPRVIIYPALLLLISTAFFFALRAQGPAYVTILRGLGRPFTQLPGGEISNPVRIKIFNRTDNAVRYLVEVEDPGFRVASETDPIVIEGGKSATIAAAVIAPPGALDHGVRAVVLRITDGADLVVERKYRLVGPGSEGEHHEDKPDSHEEPGKPQEHKQ